MRRILTIATALFFIVQVAAHAAAATPVLITFGPCPAGSVRSFPWALFEDRNGDGYYDYVTAGDCDGTTKGRPVPNVSADPFTPTSADYPFGQVPAGSAIDSVRLHSVAIPSGGTLYSWTVTEYEGGEAVCSHSRTNSGALVSTCPIEDLGFLSR